MGLLSSGKTHIGMKRKSNQDSIYLNPKKNIFIVADGMGGHNGGDIASALAVKHVPEYMIKNYQVDPDKATVDSFNFANQAIKAVGEEDEVLAGMGTTIVSFYFKGPNLYLGNVGDSRAYLVNKKKLFQLTKDHSLVQEKINLGIYNRDEAAKDPQKNILVRTVGFEDDIEVDSFIYKVSRNDIFLSCSDGLHGKVSDRDILYIINNHIKDPSTCTQEQIDQTVDALIDQANKNGGNDNISVVLVIAK